MIKRLTLIHLPPHVPYEEKDCGDVFTIKTCQRILILGFNKRPFHQIENLSAQYRDQLEVLEGSNAYQFFLETLCGLKSKILGENEIVSQFKEAYRNFMMSELPNSHIIKLLEKLLKDTKQIRHEHLLQIGQQTYAGIVRKMILEKLPSYSDKKVLILGSGKLAEDLVKLLYKKHELSLCARNQERPQQIKNTYQISIFPWESYQESLISHPIVINTVGHDTILYNEETFSRWSQNHPDDRLFICLGEPSPVAQFWGPSQCVYQLKHVFQFGEVQGKKKDKKLLQAHHAIKTTVKTREDSFTLNLPFGFEEMQFI